MRDTRFVYIFIGLLFAMLWASASAAGKFGLRSMEPLLFFTYRFLAAGVLMIVFAHPVMGYRIPKGNEWKQITLFGAFNTTLYLGIFIVALQYVAAGITTMAIALNPLLISIMSSVVMKRRVLGKEWVGIIIGMLGVALATYPLVKSGHSTLGGVL